jgi:translation elongation factor EF-Ts
MLKHAAGCLSRRCLATLSKQETLEQVKQLRAQTGAPLGDVRKALENSHYDTGLALQALRILGVAAVAKKASRSACEVCASISPMNARVGQLP